MDFMYTERVYLFCALYPEAEPLIRHFALRRIKGGLPFDRYADDRGERLLTLTGTGSVDMAAAVGAVLGQSGSHSDICLINWGSCGGSPGEVEPGQVYRCCRITAESSGRDLYPDILIRTRLPEAALLSADRLYRGKRTDVTGRRPENEAKETELPILHDMEGAAFFQAASHFAGPHQIHVIKAVTDLGTPEELTRQSFQALMTQAARGALPEMERLMAPLGDREGDRGVGSPSEEALFAELARAIDCSETMCAQLRELIHYAGLTGRDPEGWLHEKRALGLIPCTRRQGKILIGELREWLGKG